MYSIRCAMFLTIIVLFTSNAFAQNSNGGTITGSVKAKPTNQPIGYVSVMLYRVSDSAVVKGTMTDVEGKFILNRIPSDSYYLLFSCAGYADIKSAPFIFDTLHQNNAVGTMFLTETHQMLNKIVVSDEKMIINTSIDRKIYNVDSDIMSKAGSASDLLQNIPSVSVDIEGNVSLRGSTNVTILINGRTSSLMGKNRAEVLEQMPSNAIERIEVITNPSAKYKPDGTAGIINLVMKKDTQRGLNGTISANGGVSSRYGGSCVLNYNPGHFNLFGNYGVRKDDRNRYATDSREYLAPDASVNSYYTEDNKSYAHPLSHIVSLGLDFNPDAGNRLGISGNYHYWNQRRTETSGIVSKNSEQLIQSSFSRVRLNNELENENEATVYYDHSFAKKDHRIDFEFTISSQPEKENNHNTETYIVPEQIPTYDNSLVKQNEKSNQLTIEYSNPFSENSTLETGFSLEANNQDIDNYAEYFDESRNLYARDTARINRFLFDERIYSMYGTFEHSFDKLSFLAGLRVEYSINKPDLVTTGQTIRNEYTNVYPSMHLAYQLSEKSELQLNYSRRTNRPEGDEMNPFPEYDDPSNIRAGNPRLRPEYIHSVEFGWQLRVDAFSITPSVYYRYKYNGFTSVTEPVSDSVLLTTIRNLSSDQSAGLELIINGSMGRFLNTDVSVNTFYNTIDALNIGFSTKKSIVIWSGNFNIDFKLNQGTTLQMNSYYRSSRLTPQGTYLANFVANIGMRQNLLNDKLSFVLTVSDIFKTRNQKIELRTVGLNRDMKTSRDSRIIYASLMYHFGTAQKKSKDKPLEYDNNL